MAKASKQPKRSPKRRTYKRKRRAPKKKTKPGNKGYRAGAKLFRFAGQRTQLQKARDDLRSNETLKKQRYGFKLMWSEVPKVMRRYKIGEVGSYDKENVHNGVCWGWPKECKLTNLQARTIFFDIYKRKQLTIHQLIVVRKSMSYAWELSGHVPGGNYPGVKEVWKIVKENLMAQQQHHVIPERIPEVHQLRVAFLKEWTPASPMTLVEYCGRLIAAYDLFIFGLRSTEDVKRVKQSAIHYSDWENGWQATEFLGGRAKLCGVKKGTRPWRVWRRCHCPGGQHIRPPRNFYTTIRKDGNPKYEVKWVTNCPVACVEFIFSLQYPPAPKRCYPNWLASGRMGLRNISDVPNAAIEWFVRQNAVQPENRFCRNSGRKSCARWTHHLKIPYAESFQMHGDLWEVWFKNYAADLPKSEYSIRSQSTDPEIATLALRKFANFLGRGKVVKPRLPQNDRFQSDSLKSILFVANK